MRTALLSVSAIAVLAVTVIALAGNPAPAAPSPKSDPLVEEARPPEQSASGPIEQPEHPASDRLELPDGTFVATLNDTRGALSLRECWGARPWSPIDRIERTTAGVDWYVHRDGTRTTTEMKWRPDLGRLDALTRIAVPNDVAAPPHQQR